MLIDGHSHMTPARLPAALEDTLLPRWPSMRCTHADRALYIGEQRFRVLDDRSWDINARLAAMDEDGVDIQVVSPMPELLSHWLPDAATEHLADCVNDAIAMMVARAPGRFRGLGMVPLNDADHAARYTRTLRERFGLHGVEIGSNVDGRMIGDAALLPFWQAANEQSLAVFVHALHPLATRGLAQWPGFAPVVGFPLDVAQTAASLILSGIPERFPNVRIAFSHGGGGLAPMLGRMDISQRLGLAGDRRSAPLPSVSAKRLFFDSNVYDPAMLRYLVRTMAPGHVFLGTDFPYDLRQHAPHDYLASAELDASEIASVSYGAIQTFLGEE